LNCIHQTQNYYFIVWLIFSPSVYHQQGDAKEVSNKFKLQFQRFIPISRRHVEIHWSLKSCVQNSDERGHSRDICKVGYDKNHYFSNYTLAKSKSWALYWSPTWERESGYHNSNLSKSRTLCTSFALCRAANANCAKFMIEIMRSYYT